MVLLSPTPERVADILSELTRCELAGNMSPAMAETLFGRIGFVLTTAVGAIGRAATQPLLQRAHESGGGRSLPFTPAMQHMLDFFRVLLPAIPPLAVRCGPDQADDLHRVEVYVNTIALLTVEEETGEETYRGALAMLKALRKAKSLNTSELLLKVPIARVVDQESGS